MTEDNKNTLNAPHCVENTLKLFDTYLFFILLHRFLFQLAHLLLEALQHRVRANGLLDYAFRWLGDAFLYALLNFGFLGSHIFLVLYPEKIKFKNSRTIFVK